MKKIILITGIAVVLLAGSIGGTFFYLSRHHTTADAHKPPPKPIFFAQLPDLVVTVPADTSNPASTYVQITLQFASFDTNAVTAFTNLQPIIKAQIIALLMDKTAKALMDTSTHDALTQSCLGIVNNVLNKAANYTPPNPFTAAYITNLVEQN